ncbi:DUF4838 domain-containing protein [Nonomuraea sp. bgisy101]|uniref:DUF4838 domain-containing protein n=1 Tax=Nonomuraea sp. bgisy101 TaxID=3413784 RepID=UPI003D724951
MNRRRLLGLMGALPFVPALRPETSLPIVESGTARAAVIAPPAAQAAADELVSYIERATGVRLPRTASPGLTPIHVGSPGPDPAVPGLIRGLDPDGFVIRLYRDTVTVVGPSATGTANGVREFLERYAGVRWLMPGPDGDDVPALATLRVPLVQVREQPAFAQHSLSPLRDARYPLQQQWAQRNRMQGVTTEPIAFHHNLHSLFPVERYGQTHPEYYPGGRPPAPGKLTGWQPAFSVPGTIDAAVTGILEYFAANPAARSFSLGVNDGEGFAEADPVPAYYAWVNEVVRRVLVHHPGKDFGLLAYRRLETPPAFPLHPHVVPFLTQDRYAWVDPAVQEAGHALTERWLAVCSRLGFYDYLYGAPYLLPRMFSRRYAETIRYAKAKGVVAHYAELYPNWGEGPKPWITAKLLWNADADVDRLHREWCERAVGTAAADDLSAYFGLWERFWAERVPGSAWFLPEATYQTFNLPQYLDLVEESDLTRSRALLDSVVSRTATPAQRARATIMRRAFEFYEASALSYPRPVDAPDGQAAALALLQHGVDTFQRRLDLAARRQALIKEFATDPVLVLQMNPGSYPNLTWTGWNPGEYWTLVDHLRVHEPVGGPVTDRARALAADHPYAALILRGVSAVSLVANPSFEAGLAPWELLDRSNGTRAISRPPGEAVLRVTGHGWGGPSQVIDIDPGLARLTAVHRTPSGTSASVQLALDLLEQNGTPIPNSSVRSPVIALDPSGTWTPLRLDCEIPSTARGKEVGRVRLIFLVDSATDVTVDFDDVTLRTMAKPPAGQGGYAGGPSVEVAASSTV